MNVGCPIYCAMFGDWKRPMLRKNFGNVVKVYSVALKIIELVFHCFIYGIIPMISKGDATL